MNGIYVLVKTIALVNAMFHVEKLLTITCDINQDINREIRDIRFQKERKNSKGVR
jgi:hypothetical protein